MKYSILHNPRCSKSREGLEILEQSAIDFEVINYLDKMLSIEQLQELAQKLWKKAIDFTRTREIDFRMLGLDKSSSDIEIFSAMQKYPKLLQRPIVFNENSAVIGRPPENIKDFIT